MLVVILLFSLTLLILLAALHPVLIPYLQGVRSKKRLKQEGIEAEAVILDIQATGIYLNNMPQVKLQMQVYPRSGRHFVAEAFEVLSYLDVHQVQTGRSLLVKYNPANPKEVMVVWQGATTPYPF